MATTKKFIREALEGLAALSVAGIGCLAIGAIFGAGFGAFLLVARWVANGELW